MTGPVLDASVVVAAVLQEPGGERIAGHTARPVISAVNYAEVRSRLVDLGMTRARIDETLDLFKLDIIGFDAAQAEEVAALRERTRSAGLSLGDRACLWLAISRGAPALTADKAWKKIDLPVQIELVR